MWFIGEDLDGWHRYVDDPTVDPKTVWQVRHGAIWRKGDTLTLKVNGTLQNTATGMQVPEKGYIGLQSEGAPIMFRNIKLTPLP
jgi:hypothetical protein